MYLLTILYFDIYMYNVDRMALLIGTVDLYIGPMTLPNHYMNSTYVWVSILCPFDGLAHISSKQRWEVEDCG